MATPPPWLFSQTVPPYQQLTLAGWSAPFGRPRKGTVVGTGTSLRVSTTRYPGNDGPPTRHVFGRKERDWDMNGRWMDKALPSGSAAAVADQWKAFVNQKKPVRIAWGDILSYTGLIESLELDWESPNEIVWRMHILIDSEDGDQKTRQLSTPQPRVAEDVEVFTPQSLVSLPTRVPSLDTFTGELFDALDDLIQPVAQLSGSAVALANSVGNFESASNDELQRLRATLAQFQTAYATLSETVDSMGDDAMLFDRQADDDLRWLGFKRDADVREVDMQSMIANTKRAIDIVSRGQASSAYIAKPGDTWESISTSVYGGPENAGKLRAANGIRYGEQPFAGRQYQVPRV